MRKEAYLMQEFIAEMERKYFRERKMEKIRGELAILGVDMQRHFLKPEGVAYLPSSREFLEGVMSFYAFAKESGIKIILTRHCHAGNNLARWWGDEMICDDKSTEIVDEIKKFGDEIIEKSTYSAFMGTNLEEKLREEGIGGIIITGVMTHLCCETTARDAFNRGFDVIFPIDGTLTQNEELHECSLRAISHGFGVAPTLSYLLKYLRKI